MDNVRSWLIFTISMQAFEIPDFVWFQSPETGFNFQNWSEHFQADHLIT